MKALLGVKPTKKSEKASDMHEADEQRNNEHDGEHEHPARDKHSHTEETLLNSIGKDNPASSK